MTTYRATVDPFNKLHPILRAGRYRTALGLILDANTGRLRNQFNVDRNHSWYCVGDILFKQKKFNDSLLAFRRASRSRPDDAQALMAIGNCYDALSRPRYAERYFRRALAAARPREFSRLRHDITFNLANSLFDQGRMYEAIEFYRTLSRAPAELRAIAKANLALAKRRVKE